MRWHTCDSDDLAMVQYGFATFYLHVPNGAKSFREAVLGTHLSRFEQGLSLLFVPTLTTPALASICSVLIWLRLHVF